MQSKKLEPQKHDLPEHGEEGRDVIVSEQQQSGQPTLYQTLVSVEPWVKNKHVNLYAVRSQTC